MSLFLIYYSVIYPIPIRAHLVLRPKLYPTLKKKKKVKGFIQYVNWILILWYYRGYNRSSLVNNLTVWQCKQQSILLLDAFQKRDVLTSVEGSVLVDAELPIWKFFTRNSRPQRGATQYLKSALWTQCTERGHGVSSLLLWVIIRPKNTAPVHCLSTQLPPLLCSAFHCPSPACG